MNTYSHLVLAESLVQRIKPSNLADYYLGAIIPDIRYYSQMKRSKTHKSAEKVLAFAEKYPHLRSFVMGYHVHCTIDRLNLPELVWKRPLLKQLRNRLPRKLAPVLIEFYYLETANLSIQLATSSNEMLDELQINPDHVTQMAQQLNLFLADPSFISGLKVIEHLKLSGKGVEKYLRVAHFLHRHKRLSNLLFASANMNTFTAQAVKQLETQLKIEQLL